jgi:hypothetical protein
MAALTGGYLGAVGTTPAGGGVASALPGAFVAAGVMLLLWVLLRWQWRRQRTAAARPSPIDHVAELRQSSHKRLAEQQAGAKLMQLTRRLLAQIEGRAAQLESLIADADDRIAQLGREAGGAGGRGRQRGPEVEAEAGPSDPVSRGVYELADRGLAPVEIARELDQHVGAVELILALRPR